MSRKREKTKFDAHIPRRKAVRRSATKEHVNKYPKEKDEHMPRLQQ